MTKKARPRDIRLLKARDQKCIKTRDCQYCDKPIERLSIYTFTFYDDSFRIRPFAPFHPDCWKEYVEQS